MYKRIPSPWWGGAGGRVATGLLFPNAAYAECLGQGCYDGVAIFLGTLAALALAFIVTLIVLLVKRKFKAAAVLVGICVTALFIAAFLV
jgi:hypothetical protein